MGLIEIGIHNEDFFFFILVSKVLFYIQKWVLLKSKVHFRGCHKSFSFHWYSFDPSGDLGHKVSCQSVDNKKKKSLKQGQLHSQQKENNFQDIIILRAKSSPWVSGSQLSANDINYLLSFTLLCNVFQFSADNHSAVADVTFVK